MPGAAGDVADQARRHLWRRAIGEQGVYYSVGREGIFLHETAGRSFSSGITHTYILRESD
jgi:hypothetical protein